MIAAAETAGKMTKKKIASVVMLGAACHAFRPEDILPLGNVVNRCVREAEIMPEGNLITAKRFARGRVVNVHKLRVGRMDACPFAPTMSNAGMGHDALVADNNLDDFSRGRIPRARWCVCAL